MVGLAGLSTQDFKYAGRSPCWKRRGGGIHPGPAGTVLGTDIPWRMQALPGPPMVPREEGPRLGGLTSPLATFGGACMATLWRISPQSEGGRCPVGSVPGTKHGDSRRAGGPVTQDPVGANPPTPCVVQGVPVPRPRCPSCPCGSPTPRKPHPPARPLPGCCPSPPLPCRTQLHLLAPTPPSLPGPPRALPLLLLPEHPSSRAASTLPSGAALQTARPRPLADPLEGIKPPPAPPPTAPMSPAAHSPPCLSLFFRKLS